MMSAPLSQFPIHDELGVLLARQQARRIASKLGFEARDQAEIAFAVTHVACEAVRHAGGAQVAFRLEGDDLPSLAIRVIDHPSARPDPSLRDLESARRMMDDFEVDTSTGSGTTVAMGRNLPLHSLAALPLDVARIAEEMREFDPASPVSELLQLDEELFRTGDLRTRFLASVSHELRTPLASILSLARLLLDRADGELSVEQDRQTTFILRAANDLSRLVNNLLDMAQIEAGNKETRFTELHLPRFFAALEAMTRPLLPPGSRVRVSFDDPSGLPSLCTDEVKLTLILRNFVSNAIQFTENGEIRIHAERGPGESVVFSVSDTGLGIAAEHLERIFEDFGQVASPNSLPVEGTGLGLPLARKLAWLLGGQVGVRSEPGKGSTFTATIPIRLPGSAEDCPFPA